MFLPVQFSRFVSTWGRRTKTAGDLDADFGYTGHYRHAATGLALALYRAYDPSLGRWLSEDPIGLAGGLNLHAYVGNSPVNLSDPLGLYERDVHHDQTARLAREAGFSELNDENSLTAPFGPLAMNFGARRQFHFTTPEQRERLRNKAYSALCGAQDEGDIMKALLRFGEYLHALQDSYSHQTSGATRGNPSRWPFGHALWPEPGHAWTHWYDKPENRPALAEQMLQETATEMQMMQTAVEQRREELAGGTQRCSR